MIFIRSPRPPPRRAAAASLPARRPYATINTMKPRTENILKHIHTSIPLLRFLDEELLGQTWRRTYDCPAGELQGGGKQFYFFYFYLK